MPARNSTKPVQGMTTKNNEAQPVLAYLRSSQRIRQHPEVDVYSGVLLI